MCTFTGTVGSNPTLSANNRFRARVGNREMILVFGLPTRDFRPSFTELLLKLNCIFITLFNKMTSPITEVKLYSHYINHNIGFWARLCPSFLTFHQGPVKPRSLSEPHKILIAILNSGLGAPSLRGV